LRATLRTAPWPVHAETKTTHSIFKATHYGRIRGSSHPLPSVEIRDLSVEIRDLSVEIAAPSVGIADLSPGIADLS
jgi:hypothetical protein